jgi:hypothetical protein
LFETFQPAAESKLKIYLFVMAILDTVFWASIIAAGFAVSKRLND